MEILTKETHSEHEKVLFASDAESGYRGIIAVHSTALGPAVGGTRFWNYASEEEALTDALRLSRGMTYKNALPGLPLGGGKAVIINDGKTGNREEIFRAHGRFVETLGGRFITAEDVGTSPADMEIIQFETKHVAGVPSGAGDPSPFTARGVFRAIQAAARYSSNRDNPSGLTVALQGCGHVGYYLAKYLNNAGAELIVSDVDREKTLRIVEEFDAVAVQPDDIYEVSADVFAPCALGGVINDLTIPRLRARIVAGAANNQLLEDRHGDVLKEKGVLYVPDYAANAGGVFAGCTELLGWTIDDALQKVDEIYDTVLRIFELAKAEGVSTNNAADQIAENRLRTAKQHNDRPTPSLN